MPCMSTSHITGYVQSRFGLPLLPAAERALSAATAASVRCAAGTAEIAAGAQNWVKNAAGEGATAGENSPGVVP